jgi:esterase/lipase
MTIELIITILTFLSAGVGVYIKMQLDLQKNTDKIEHMKDMLELKIDNLSQRSAEREDRFITSIDKLETAIEDLRKSINNIQQK